MLVKLSNTKKKKKNKNIQMLKMMKKIKNARNLINTKKLPRTYSFSILFQLSERLCGRRRNITKTINYNTKKFIIQFLYIWKSINLSLHLHLVIPKVPIVSLNEVQC